MRDITKILQKSIGGGKTIISTLSAPKTAISIACGRTLLWMFFLFCATLTTVSCSDDDSEPSAYDRLQGTWEVYEVSTPGLPVNHGVWDGTCCTFAADSLVVYRTESGFDYGGNPLPDIVTTLHTARVESGTADRIVVDGTPADVVFGNGTAKVACQEWSLSIRNRKATTGK